MKALVLLAALGCATASPPIDAEAERAFYRHTVDGLEGRGQFVDPAAVDWRRFRQAAHLSLDEGARADQASALRVLAEARARSDDHALPRVVDQLLRLDFADAQAHLERARTLHFDDRRGAALHEAVALGLLRSIVDSGDGDARPWTVFEAHEEAAVASFLDLRCDRRSSSTEGGRRLDVLECRDHRGLRRRLRFDATPSSVM